MSTLMEIMPDKPRVSIDVNTNGDNARQAHVNTEILMSRVSIDVNTNDNEIMSTSHACIDVNTNEIMPDKPRVSIDVNTNGDNEY